MVWLFEPKAGWGPKVGKFRNLKMAFRHQKNFFLWFYQFFYIMIVKCLISYVTIQIFRPNGRLLWFLYNFKKKFPKKKIFQNFQKVDLWSPIKGSRVIFEQKHFGIPPYYNPRAIHKKKKGEIFTIGFFLTDSSY